MNKSFKIFSLSVLMLIVLMSVASAATETFENFTQGSSYGDNSFTGIEDTVWNYEDARNEYSPYEIDAEGMVFRDTNGKIYSDTISGGIANFSVKLSDGDSVTEDRQVELYINGDLKGTSTAFDDDTTHTFEVNDINVEGDIVIEIRNVLNSHIIIDDVTWTSYTAEEEPAEPEEITACSLVDEGNLSVNIKDISVVKGFGDDEEWLPFDEVEIEVEVENKNDEERIKNIQLEWGLWSEETNEWIIDLDDHKIKDFDIKKDDQKITTFKFKLNKKQLDVALDELVEGDYTLYVVANGEEQGDPEFSVCSMDSEAISIIIESDFVILDNIQIAESVSCGGEVQITADVWNIGDSDQNDGYVIIYNKELGINKKVEIGNIDSFEDEKLDVIINMPENAEEKSYDLTLWVYNEDNEIYENDYDDQKSEFSVSLNVEDSCSTVPLVSVSASLESDAKVGGELIIKATIENTGSSKTTFNIELDNYSDWASLVNIDTSILELDAGESKEITITLKVNDNVSGDKSFDILIKDGEKVLSQPVSVSIESASPFPGITGLFSGIAGDNWYLYGIGALNILLILIIIVVAIRVAKKKE